MSTVERTVQERAPAAAAGEGDGGGIKEAVREFVRDNFYMGEDDSIADGDSFLDLGVIDSTGILEVVAFLEERFGIEVDDSELVPENLDSVSSVAAFVARKKGARRG